MSHLKGLMSRIHTVIIYIWVVFGTIVFGSLAIAVSLVDRTGVDPERIDDVVGGCITQSGEQGCNVTRNAWVAAGMCCDMSVISLAETPDLASLLSRVLPLMARSRSIGSATSVCRLAVIAVILLPCASTSMAAPLLERALMGTQATSGSSGSSS